MTAEIPRLKPKRHVLIAQAAQTLLDLPPEVTGLDDPARDRLAAIADRYDPAPSWTFTMLSPEQLRIVLKKINASDKPALTLRVWSALVTHVQMNTGEIMASRSELSEDAETTPQEVSRALSRLADMGALIRLRPGRYAINPHVGWAGSMAAREAATQGVPRLRLVPQA
jgi:DNA-binding transcriptional ArsR family regulator